ALAGERLRDALLLEVRRAVEQRGPLLRRDVAEREEAALHLPAPLASTVRRIAIDSSICSRVTMYGGANRTTLSPATETSRPFSRHAPGTCAGRPLTASPRRSPRPRTSVA